MLWKIQTSVDIRAVFCCRCLGKLSANWKPARKLCFRLSFGLACSLSNSYAFCLCFRFKKRGVFGGVSFSFPFSNPYCCNFLIYGISAVAEKYQEMFKCEPLEPRSAANEIKIQQKFQLISELFVLLCFQFFPRNAKLCQAWECWNHSGWNTETLQGETLKARQ